MRAAGRAVSGDGQGLHVSVSLVLVFLGDLGGPESTAKKLGLNFSIHLIVGRTVSHMIHG